MGSRVITNVPGYVYSYWDTGLSPETTYNYYVLAEDEDGNISAAPASIPFITTVEETGEQQVVLLAAGNDYSTVVLYDSTARSWGTNYRGALGTGSSTETATPLPVIYNEVYFSDVSALSAYTHTLAVRNDGTVWAWGSNESGELGLAPDFSNHNTPIPVSGLTNIKAIATGEEYSLALGSDGTVWSWGSNYDGQLGNRFDIDYSTEDGYTPMRVVSPDGTGFLTDVIAISASCSTSMALRSDGTVWTWGTNSYGNLGIGTTDNNEHPVPVQVNGLSDIMAIAAGYNHYLALKSDGTVWAWGENYYYGQLGDGTFTNRSSPVQVTGLDGVTALSAGEIGSMALKEDGTVWTWGSNYDGLLGDGVPEGDASDYSLIPIQVVGVDGIEYITNAVAIDAGVNHNIAVLGDGTVVTWGANDSGQLGIGTTDYDSHPIPTPALLQPILPLA